MYLLWWRKYLYLPHIIGGDCCCKIGCCKCWERSIEVGGKMFGQFLHLGWPSLSRTIASDRSWKYERIKIIPTIISLLKKNQSYPLLLIDQRSKIKDQRWYLHCDIFNFTTLYISIIDVKLMVHSANPGFGILKSHNCVSSSILGSYSRISSSV